jgi:hypothetical protein
MNSGLSVIIAGLDPQSIAAMKRSVSMDARVKPGQARA